VLKVLAVPVKSNPEMLCGPLSALHLYYRVLTKDDKK